MSTQLNWDGVSDSWMLRIREVYHAAEVRQVLGEAFVLLTLYTCTLHILVSYQSQCVAAYFETNLFTLEVNFILFLRILRLKKTGRLEHLMPLLHPTIGSVVEDITLHKRKIIRFREVWLSCMLSLYWHSFHPLQKILSALIYKTQ